MLDALSEVMDMTLSLLPHLHMVFSKKALRVSALWGSLDAFNTTAPCLSEKWLVIQLNRRPRLLFDHKSKVQEIVFVVSSSVFMRS